MATKKKNSPVIYKLTLYRFGYDLTVVTDNKKKGIKILMDEYIQEYVKRNGTSPMDDLSDSYFAKEGQTYYDVALEDIETKEYDLNTVWWM